MPNRIAPDRIDDTPLGAYLRDRRAKLDPAAFGLPMSRRRTPGLRREEVAQRAGVSATWYTWLEQGRGGAPSADALDRIARALMLTEVEREHLYLIGLGRPPDVRFHETEGVSPRLQRFLDCMEFSPALVKTSTADIIGWNEAALTVLGDYTQLAPEERNLLRILFCQPRIRAAMLDWERHARFVVAVFRAELARKGASARASSLIEEVSRVSPEFREMWRDNAVAAQGEGTKRLSHPIAGELSMEYSSFTVDGRPDLSVIVYTPATAADVERVRELVRRRRATDDASREADPGRSREKPRAA